MDNTQRGSGKGDGKGVFVLRQSQLYRLFTTLCTPRCGELHSADACGFQDNSSNRPERFGRSYD